MGRDKDYLFVLKALYKIPFPVGKKMLSDILTGQESKQIIQHGLKKLEYFGCLAYSEEEIDALLNMLLSNNLVEYKPVSNSSFIKALHLTFKGIGEMNRPELYKKQLAYNYKEIVTAISDKERIFFSHFPDFLENYNDAQKKAIISGKNNILCLAGAGSGKTTVLTKRIEFMTKYKSVEPSNILAITFTRKAREQMRDKLNKIGSLDEVKIETFNSFCEKILRKYNDLAYDKPIRVVSYRDKIVIMNKALNHMGITIDKAIESYFSYAQIRGKTNEQLSNILLNDAFFVRDYFKSKNKMISLEELNIKESKHEKAARLFFGICNYIENYMEKHGLRDFSDQLLDAIRLFKAHPGIIPKFDHVLVDEYQDVNKTQIDILELLNSPNLFVVGDPRQSIYGWRGSDINYILNFEKNHDDAELIGLSTNYRSTKKIVDLFNEGIKNMNLPHLESNSSEKGEIKLFNFEDDNSEDSFVINKIKESSLNLSEIFVLTRVNKRLNELSEKFKQAGIPHIVKSNENKVIEESPRDAVVLSTIHAIKGLEADTVFVIGCTPNNFPCIGTEHPVIEMIKIDEYDKEEEEKRVFYVAMSRAKKNLFLTYSTKNHTSYITPKMEAMINGSKIGPAMHKNIKSEKQVHSFQNKSLVNSDVSSRLKNWRYEQSKKQNIPAYMIFNDKTLIDLCQKKPLTEDELEDVYGFGALKIAKYGKEVLDIINGI